MLRGGPRRIIVVPHRGPTTMQDRRHSSIVGEGFTFRHVHPFGLSRRVATWAQGLYPSALSFPTHADLGGGLRDERTGVPALQPSGNPAQDLRTFNRFSARIMEPGAQNESDWLQELPSIAEIFRTYREPSHYDLAEWLGAATIFLDHVRFCGTRGLISALRHPDMVRDALLYLFDYVVEPLRRELSLGWEDERSQWWGSEAYRDLLRLPRMTELAASAMVARFSHAHHLVVVRLAQLPTWCLPTSMRHHLIQAGTPVVGIVRAPRLLASDPVIRIQDTIVDANRLVLLGLLSSAINLLEKFKPVVLAGNSLDTLDQHPSYRAALGASVRAVDFRTDTALGNYFRTLSKLYLLEHHLDSSQSKSALRKAERYLNLSAYFYKKGCPGMIHASGHIRALEGLIAHYKGDQALAAEKAAAAAAAYECCRDEGNLQRVHLLIKQLVTADPDVPFAAIRSVFLT